MAQTTYEAILHYNKLLEEQVAASVPFELSNFPSSFIIQTNSSTKELGRLLQQSEYGLLVSLGIDDSNTADHKFTVSFLVVDENKKILCSHITGALKGEETWPAESVSNFPETIDTFDPGDC